MIIYQAVVAADHVPARIPGAAGEGIGYFLQGKKGGPGVADKMKEFPDWAGLSQPDVFFPFLLWTFTDVLHLGHEVYQSAFPL